MSAMEDKDTKRLTIVFAYDTQQERKQLFDMFDKELYKRDSGLRIIALSDDNELTRCNLIEQALEKFGHYEQGEVIQEILNHTNLASFTWTD
jgi:hypothetical protein